MEYQPEGGSDEEQISNLSNEGGEEAYQSVECSNSSKQPS